MRGNFMPSLMPSLFKYFTVVGAVLVVALIGLNAVLEPGGPGPSMVKPQPKARSIRHDPGASLVERLRAEEAARKAAVKDEANAPTPQPVTVAAPAAPAPVPPAQPVQLVTQAAAQPAPAAAAEPAQAAPAALIGVPTQDEAAQAVRHAQEKIAAEKARKKRLAQRAKAKAIEEASAARQQDQFYYGYAPRPTYGPFGQGGLQAGGGWNRGW